MSAGVFGYLGYDMVRRMEKLPPAKPDPIGVPDVLLIRPTVMVVFDAARDEMAIVTPVRPAPGVSAKAAHESGAGATRRGRRRARGPARPRRRRQRPTRCSMAGEPVSNTTEAEYKAMVAKAKDYIAAGDAFQIVLSQRFTSRFDLPAFSLYRALRRVNPSPYLCLPRLRRLPDRRVEPGDPGPGARRQGRHPADRRHPAARQDARARTRRWRPSCSPIRRSAPST